MTISSFRFYNSVKIISGENALDSLGYELKQLGSAVSENSHSRSAHDGFPAPVNNGGDGHDAIEACICKPRNPFSNAHSMEAIKLIGKHLPLKSILASDNTLNRKISELYPHPIKMISSFLGPCIPLKGVA
jgi:hypothetical protein